MATTPKIARALDTAYLSIPPDKSSGSISAFLSLNEIESFDPEEFPARHSPAVDCSERLHQHRLRTLKATRKHIHDYCRRADFTIQQGHAGAGMIMAELCRNVFAVHCHYGLEEERVHAAHAREVAHARDYTPSRLWCTLLKTRRDLKRMREAAMSNAAARRDRRLADLQHARALLHRQLIMITVAECDLIWHPQAAVYDGRIQGGFAYAPVQAYQLVRGPADVAGLYHLTLPWEPAPGATHRPSEMHIHRGRDGKYLYSSMRWVDRGELGSPGAVESFYSVRIVVKDGYVAEDQEAQRLAEERRVVAAVSKKRANGLWARLFWTDCDFFNLFGKR